MLLRTPTVLTAPLHWVFETYLVCHPPDLPGDETTLGVQHYIAMAMLVQGVLRMTLVREKKSRGILKNHYLKSTRRGYTC